MPLLWVTVTKDDISMIEMVQQRAACFIYNDFSSYSSISFMLSKLNWKSLEQRRTKPIITTCMFYKIINKLIEINFSQHIHPITS